MRIAVTGGVAEGKSTLAARLAALGLRCVSADDLARTVRAEPSTRRLLANEFGIDESHLEDGLRKALAEPAGRRKLNALMHPLVWRRLQSTAHDVAEIPLLVETCLYDAYDYVVVVACGEAEQLRRLTARLGDEAAARRTIAAQLPSRAKKPFADLIVRTDGPQGGVLSATRKIAFVLRETP